MLELNSTNCHNFKKAIGLGRCPLISVCNEDCVFVWKNTYDIANEAPSISIEELENRISDLEREVNVVSKERDDAQSSAEDWESKYTEVLDDLAGILKDDSVEKLENYCSEQKIGEWANDIRIRRL